MTLKDTKAIVALQEEAMVEGPTEILLMAKIDQIVDMTQGLMTNPTNKGSTEEGEIMAQTGTIKANRGEESKTIVRLSLWGTYL